MRLPALFSALLVAVLLAACGDEGPVRLNVGDPAPAFAAPALDGQVRDFPAAFAGKPLVIRFWADWCRYCAGEMQGMQRVYERQHQHGLEIVAINAGQDRATVEAFVRKIGIGYPALIDENAEIARKYGVVGLPTSYFIDRQGVVRAKIVGEADEATFERQVQELLK